MEPVKIFVVEDQPKILKNLMKLLNGFDEIKVIGNAMSGEDALEGIEKDKPEVILLDLGLPQMSGIDVTREVKKKYPEIEILIFTIFDEEEKVMEAIQAGASGYLLKGMEAEKIVEAIREVKDGGSVIQPSLARSLLRHFQNPPAQLQEEDFPKLTPREIEILQIIAKGLSNAEAGRVLKISRATIRTHLEHIYAKMSVSNRVEAITEGIRQGLIDI
ncbi:MAG: response regulator transcription factor [Deltaproteobacteria bacterium]|nr:response regulator transcription factor [Deltaproteobacteria bacterium]